MRSKLDESVLYGLYMSLIRDIGVDFTEQGYNNFIKQVRTAFKRGVIDLSNQQISASVLTNLTKVFGIATNARKLNLYGNLIADHGLSSVIQLLLTYPSITVLDIGCNNLTNQGMSAILDIIRNTNITSLQLGAAGLPWHKNTFSLKSLRELFEELLITSKIKCLGLSGIPFTARKGSRRYSIVAEFTEFIRQYDVLHTLSISDCSLLVHDAEKIFLQGLSKNTGIHVLDVSLNKLPDQLGVDFSSNLAYMNGLRSINLSNCDLSDTACSAIASALKYSKLISLNLSKNNIATSGFIDILNVLCSNTKLTVLDVSFNLIGPDVSKLLGVFLQKNGVLAELDLSGNPIGDAGAFSIANAIKLNEGLTSLSLSTCRISDTGAISLADALKDNENLIAFRLSNNFITRDAGYVLIEHLRKNEKLKVLDLSSNQIDHLVIKAAHEICQRNTHIEQEAGTQHLKREIIQLSIQRTKIPEAKSRLDSISSKLDSIDDSIITTKIELENIIRDSNAKIDDLQKRIHSKENDISMAIEEMKSQEIEHEKQITQGLELVDETKKKTELEKMRADEAEKGLAALENEIRAQEDEFLSVKDNLSRQIEHMKAETQRIMSLMEDNELVKGFNLEAQESIPVFIVDQISQERSQQVTSLRGKASKRPRKSKKR